MERMIPGLSPRHIEDDHVQRYLWAARRLGGVARVLDYGCGIGYGSHILANGGALVNGVDVSMAGELDADVGRTSAGGVILSSTRLVDGWGDPSGAVVMFEVVEHIEDPGPGLDGLAKNWGRLLISTPNRNVTSPDGVVNNEFHVREYDVFELRRLLGDNGWLVTGMFGQRWQWAPKRRIMRKAYKKLFRPWERTDARVAGWGPWYPEIQPEYLVLEAVSKYRDD